jgi:hypothetical protein
VFCLNNQIELKRIDQVKMEIQSKLECRKGDSAYDEEIRKWIVLLIVLLSHLLASDVSTEVVKLQESLKSESETSLRNYQLAVVCENKSLPIDVIFDITYATKNCTWGPVYGKIVVVVVINIIIARGVSLFDFTCCFPTFLQ